MLQILAESGWADRFGWVLVHTLWQFALVAVFAVVLQWALHRCSAVTRYWALLAAMCVLVALPVVTWLWPGLSDTPLETVALMPAETPDPSSRAEPIGYSPSSRMDLELRTEAVPQLPVDEFEAPPQLEFQPPASVPVEPPSLVSIVQTHVQSWLPGIVLVWFIGVLVAALRPLLSWYTVRRLKSVRVSAVEDAVRAALVRTATRLGFTRSVEILQSALVKSPVVVGYFRPVILLPLSVLTGLPESQLEMILAHELAHIRRHDYLVNLAQTLVETLFFYHPGMWWLSREIRRERENCCDDVAMSIVDSRADYGEALLAVAQLRAAATPLSLAAQGGSLVSRMRRIAGCEPAPRLAGGGSILGIVLVSMAVLAGVSWRTAPATASPEPPETTPAAQAALSSDEVAQQTIQFKFRFQPWKDVLEWYAEKAGLSLVMKTPPPGTFNYRDTKEYTLEEAMEALNAVLLTRGFTLIRQNKELIVQELIEGIAEGDWKPGQTIDVQVVNAETGEPLPGVKLEFQYHGPGIDFQDITTKTTDADGRSQGRLPDVRPDAVRIYPTKAGFVPLRVYWGDDLPSPKLPKDVTIRMEPGKVWGGVVQDEEGQVVDEDGKPLEGVSITLDRWMDRPRQFYLKTATDADGRFRIEDAPLEKTEYDIEKKGYVNVRMQLPPSSEGYQIALRPPVWIAGSIVDGSTGQPLPRCMLTKGWEPEDGRAPQWYTRLGMPAKEITDGRYEIELGHEDRATRIRVEAEGYMPAVSRAFKPYAPDRGRVNYDIKLMKTSPMAGTVLDAANEPLADAEVFLATDAFPVKEGKPVGGLARGIHSAKTNKTGRFELPPEVEPFYLVVLHEKGFAVVDEKQFATDSTIRIERWKNDERSLQVERRPVTHSGPTVAADARRALTVRLVDEDGKPVEGAIVATSAWFSPRPNRFAPYESNWTYFSGGQSDRAGMANVSTQGRFDCVIARHAERKLVAVQGITPEQVKSSETVTITMQPQCKVFGSLTAKELEARNKKIEWSNVCVHLENRSARPMSCTPDENGFHFFLPPGSYELQAYANDTGYAWKTITVKPGQQELEVGSIDLPPSGLVLLEGKRAPELRDVVAWKNGKPVKFSDLKGKVVVLTFSGNWVADRPHEWMPNLFTICEKYADQGLAVVDIRLGGQGIDSQEQLDARLAEVKSPFWNDCDLPASIALALWRRPTFLWTENVF